MARDNEPAESAARVNHLRATTDEVIEALARRGRRGASPDPQLAEAVVLRDPYDLHGSALFERGS